MKSWTKDCGGGPVEAGPPPRPNIGAARLDRADGGSVADIHNSDLPVSLGAMNLITLHDCVGEVTGDAAHGVAVSGVDDPDAAIFCFDCVCHGIVLFVVGLVIVDSRSARLLPPEWISCLKIDSRGLTIGWSSHALMCVFCPRRGLRAVDSAIV